jgi:hypothetical protein
VNKKKVVAVLKAYREKLKARPDVYDNTLGCGNCGDIGSAFVTVRNLAEALAETLPKAQRKKFLREGVGYGY